MKYAAKLLALAVSLIVMMPAFACETPSCTSIPSFSTSTTGSVTGNISNSETSASGSKLGQGGASFAASTATVTEFATGSSGGYSSRNSAPNGTIGGGTFTQGSATVTATGASIGDAQSSAGGVAYGTGQATTTESLLSKNKNGSLQLNGTATSQNQVGVGYGVATNGGGFAQGSATVAASAGNEFSASGNANGCNVPVNGTVTDSKAGFTLTNAPVVSTSKFGNAQGGAFSPFTNGTTSNAYQTASVTGSFSATK